MCTVTYIRSGDQTILTSNRDEHKNRPPAIDPKQYQIGYKKIKFPKDPKAGGTWFATDEVSTVGILLNGAAVQHIPRAGYRKSRGLVLLDVIASDLPLFTWQQYDLAGVEPFTIVLKLPDSLHQLRWDGFDKEINALSVEQNYIWSSSTLYSPEAQRERELWFQAFLQQTPSPDAANIRHFHSYTASDNRENGLVINRGGIMKTFSITQAVIQHQNTQLFHQDLLREHRLSNPLFTV
jgi:hypothetical protein